MPIYEYKCEKCEHIFSKLESINNEQKVKVCPECGEKAHRMISLNSFHLKGGGWYASGYEKGNNTTSCSSQKSNSSACKSCPASSTAN